jgi:hypothetical protein
MRRNRELIYFAVFITLAVAACYLFAAYQVDVSQHHWCDALNTLTQHPVLKPTDPASNPSRVEAYDLYTEFLSIKGDFGCG